MKWNTECCTGDGGAKGDYRDAGGDLAPRGRTVSIDFRSHAPCGEKGDAEISKSVVSSRAHRFQTLIYYSCLHVQVRIDNRAVYLSI